MCHKTKTFLTSLLAVSLLSLSGCSNNADTSNTSSNSSSSSSSSSSSQSSGEKVTLTLWHYYNGNAKDSLDVLIHEFNDTIGAEKNIVVEAYSHSSVNDLATSLVASANKDVGVDDLPDIFAAYSDTALLLHEMGLVALLDDYFTSQELALYQQDFLNEGRFGEDDYLKILPVAKSTELLFINETDFSVFSQATGIAMDEMATWEGLARVAEAYYEWTDQQTPEEEGDGRALFGLDSEANFMLVASQQLGDSMYDRINGNMQFSLSQSSAQKIWDNLMVPYFKGHYASYGSYRSDDLKSGDLLIYVGSTSSVYYFPSVVELGRETSYEIQGVTMAYPYFEGEEKIVVQQGAGMVVSKSNETQEAAAAEFLKWFTSAENNLDFAVSTGYIPVQNSAMLLDGVIEVLHQTSPDEVAPILLDSIERTYNELMPHYDFFSSEPFNGSYDTRNAVRDSVSFTITATLEEIETLMEEGLSREEALAEVTGEDAFIAWYNDLAVGVSEILDEYAQENLS